MFPATFGQSLPRLEDRRFLTGEGKFIDDINLEGQLYGAVLRSPYAHAIIEMIDTNAAANLAGVVGVYTSNDLDAEGIGNLPCIAAAFVSIYRACPISGLSTTNRCWKSDSRRERAMLKPVAFILPGNIHHR